MACCTASLKAPRFPQQEEEHVSVTGGREGREGRGKGRVEVGRGEEGRASAGGRVSNKEEANGFQSRNIGEGGRGERSRMF